METRTLVEKEVGVDDGLDVDEETRHEQAELTALGDPLQFAIKVGIADGLVLTEVVYVSQKETAETKFPRKALRQLLELQTRGVGAVVGVGVEEATRHEQAELTALGDPSQLAMKVGIADGLSLTEVVYVWQKEAAETLFPRKALKQLLELQTKGVDSLLRSTYGVPVVLGRFSNLVNSRTGKTASTPSIAFNLAWSTLSVSFPFTSIDIP